MVYLVIVMVLVFAGFVWLGIKQNEKDRILRVLKKVDLTDPRKRKLNEYDTWFVNHVEDFCRYKKAIEYIDYYGHLEDTFWANVKNPDKNVRLQKNILRINGGSHNMLCYFAKRYQLLPKVKMWLKLRRLEYWRSYELCKRYYPDF